MLSSHPQLISDGGGLPFAPEALAGSPSPLDPGDPAVAALISYIGPKDSPRAGLDQWRLLARTEDEALFARGRPPKLLTVAVKRDRRRDTWKCTATTSEKPLRAARDQVRASSWRLDPAHELDPNQTELRLLVTEQTYAGGQRAHGRVQVPDLYVDDTRLVLTIFVTPKPGFQVRSPNPETPVRVVLPHPVGERWLVDGALYEG